MWSLEDIWKKVLDETGKDTRGRPTPAMFNTALKFGEISAVADRLGLPESYVPGKATGQEAYPLTAKIEDDLRPYLKSVEIALDVDGKAPLPLDYLRRSSVDSEYKWTETTKPISLDCEEDQPKPTVVEKSKMVNVEVMFNRNYTTKKYHSFKYPTLEYPICTFYDTGMEVSPSTIKKVQFDYISVPKGAFFAFTEVNGAIVYDAANSVQLQCPVDMYPKIASYIVRYCARNLGDTETEAYAAKNYDSGL